jgi:hypothetical protein
MFVLSVGKISPLLLELKVFMSRSSELWLRILLRWGITISDDLAVSIFREVVTTRKTVSWSQLCSVTSKFVFELEERRTDTKWSLIIPSKLLKPRDGGVGGTSEGEQTWANICMKWEPMVYLESHWIENPISQCTHEWMPYKRAFSQRCHIPTLSDSACLMVRMIAPVTEALVSFLDMNSFCSIIRAPLLNYVLLYYVVDSSVFFSF